MPVAATAHGGVLDIVKDGETGALFKPGDVTALAEAIKHCRLLPSAGFRDFVYARFTFQNIVAQTAEAYRSLHPSSQEVLKDQRPRMKSLRQLHTKLVTSFFQVGWLLPVAFPFVQMFSRGAFNSITAVYIVWGLFAMPGRWSNIDRRLLWLYLLPVIAFGLSLPGAVDLGRGMHAWFKFTFTSLTLFYTLAALSDRPENEAKFFRWLGLSAVVSVLSLLLFALFQSGFTQLVLSNNQPRYSNLPFLLPFAVFFASQLSSQYKQRILIPVIVLIFIVMVALAGGRASLVGVIAACSVLGLLRYRIHPAVLVAIVVVMLSIGAFLGGSWFFRDVSTEQSTIEILDTFSSGRTVLWRQALASPPENFLTGVGMGNVRYYENVITIDGVKVRHLHNFILDCWYETGFLGLAALFACYIGVGWRVIRTWFALDSLQRTQSATLAAAFTAIFTSGLLSFSYYSPQFTSFLFLLFAGLWHNASTSRRH